MHQANQLVPTINNAIPKKEQRKLLSSLQLQILRQIDGHMTVATLCSLLGRPLAPTLRHLESMGECRVLFFHLAHDNTQLTKEQWKTLLQNQPLPQTTNTPNEKNTDTAQPTEDTNAYRDMFSLAPPPTDPAPSQHNTLDDLPAPTIAPLLSPPTQAKTLPPLSRAYQPHEPARYEPVPPNNRQKPRETRVMPTPVRNVDELLPYEAELELPTEDMPFLNEVPVTPAPTKTLVRSPNPTPQTTEPKEATVPYPIPEPTGTEHPLFPSPRDNPFAELNTENSPSLAVKVSTQDLTESHPEFHETKHEHTPEAHNEHTPPYSYFDMPVGQESEQEINLKVSKREQIQHNRTPVKAARKRNPTKEELEQLVSEVAKLKLTQPQRIVANMGLNQPKQHTPAPSSHPKTQKS